MVVKKKTAVKKSKKTVVKKAPVVINPKLDVKEVQTKDKLVKGIVSSDGKTVTTIEGVTFTI